MILWMLATAEAMTCSFDSAGSVAFGAYDVFSGAPLDSAGTVVIRCVGVGGGDTVSVDLTAGGSGSYSARELASGPETLGYNLYRDASLTQVWGDGTAGTSRYGPVTPPEDTPVSLTVYGRVPASQSVPAGSYADTVTAVVNY